ncbi:hypothetical protein [Ottowia sp. VDI28]|uniref:hypothetical protein n=1 Tax=Ottowia sp. VDI28 TaxID=3133968 RepID=UPI003C303526
MRITAIPTNSTARSLPRAVSSSGGSHTEASPLQDRPSAEEWRREVDQALASARHTPMQLPAAATTPLKNRPNIRESFNAVAATTKEARAFKDWFHGFASTLSLLASRAASQADFAVSARRYQKLLKAELMRGQLQATYARDDADRLQRSRSPLVREGYGRAVRTGLWTAAAAIRTEQVRNMLKATISQMEDFAVYPVSRAFEYKGLTLTELTELTGLSGGGTGEGMALVAAQDEGLFDLTSLESVYIPSLRVQLVLKSKVGAAEIDGHFGRHGLRASPSECADICAESMLRKLGQGDVSGALRLLDMAFQGEAAEAVRQGLAKTELMPNTLVVLPGADPLTTSTSEQLLRLKQAYETCAGAGLENPPFYLSQNIQLMRYLIGDITEFVKPGMPEPVCGDLTDALETVAQLWSQASFMRDPYADPQAWSLHMERFYQAMQEIHRVIRFQWDWVDRPFSLSEAVTSLLLGPPRQGRESLSPQNADELGRHASVERAPHALAMLEQIRASLPAQTSVAYLAGGYYETPGLFDEPLRCDAVTHQALPEQDLIIMEPHPNNAAELRIQAYDPVALIDHLFSHRPDHPRTLVMDVTLNHLAEDQITQVLQVARPYIESGKLNLVLLQSGTKFIQNGMDLVNIGIAAIFNNQAHWGNFRACMARSRMHIPRDDEGYITRLLSRENEALSMAYLSKVRDNTAAMRTLLNAEIPWGHQRASAYEVCINTDEQTVYIALRLTDAYLARRLRRDSEAEILPEERAAENRWLYNSGFRLAFDDLAAVDRSSFGFNLTNFGECGETVRITLGIEESALLQEYAKRILQLGASLHASAFDVQ